MTDKPIGYWLKHLDNLIDAAFENVLGEHGLTRRHWQVLTTIADAATDAADLDRACAPFQDSVESEVDDLAERGWARRDGSTVTVTEEGRTAHHAVAEQARTVRTRMSVGISREDYLHTVDTLRRMAENLGG